LQALKEIDGAGNETFDKWSPIVKIQIQINGTFLTDF
jgi:hypothetical protein